MVRATQADPAGGFDLNFRTMISNTMSLIHIAQVPIRKAS
jgi:hypothetical protein